MDLGSAHDGDRPAGSRKVFAIEVFKTLASHFPSAKNGSSTSTIETPAWGDSVKRNGSTSENKNKEQRHWTNESGTICRDCK